MRTGKTKMWQKAIASILIPEWFPQKRALVSFIINPLKKVYQKTD